jgi:hypothetical protein
MKSTYFLYGAVTLWGLCLIPILAPFTALLGLVSLAISVIVTDQPNDPTERVND